MATSTIKRRGPVRVARESRALNLEHGGFRQPDARDIALALKRSPRRRRKPAHQSAFAKFTTAVSRAGKNLNAARKRVMKNARQTLRRVLEEVRREGGEESLRARARSR